MHIGVQNVIEETLVSGYLVYKVCPVIWTLVLDLSVHIYNTYHFKLICPIKVQKKLFDSYISNETGKAEEKLSYE